MAEKDFHISEKYNFRHALTQYSVSILPALAPSVPAIARVATVVIGA